MTITAATNVTIADPADIPALVGLAVEFDRLSGGVLRVNREVWVRTWQGLIGTGCAEVIVLRTRAEGQGHGPGEEKGKPIGGLGWICMPCPNSGELQAQEAFWFVGREHRGAGLKLLQAFEERAKSRGCTRLVMVHLEEVMPAKLERLYAARGYRLIERNYLKEVAAAPQGQGTGDLGLGRALRARE